MKVFDKFALATLKNFASGFSWGISKLLFQLQYRIIAWKFLQDNWRTFSRQQFHLIPSITF